MFDAMAAETTPGFQLWWTSESTPKKTASLKYL